jgi:hypothetical protein
MFYPTFLFVCTNLSGDLIEMLPFIGPVYHPAAAMNDDCSETPPSQESWHRWVALNVIMNQNHWRVYWPSYFWVTHPEFVT